MALWWGAQPLGKQGEFTEPDPGLPLTWQGAGLTPPSCSALPLCKCLSDGHVDRSLQCPSQGVRVGGAQALGSAIVPPVASPPMPLTPVVCPNDRLASVSHGDQPRTCGCTWGRAGEGQPGPPPWPVIGSPGKCVPLRQDTWLRAWSSRPSAQPPFPKAQPHSSAFCLCVFYKLFILTALGFCCCMWAFRCGDRGLLYIAGPQRLMVAASLAVRAQ